MKMCEHDCEEVRYDYFYHKGVERKGMYCTICGFLLDYIPQYKSDD